MVDQEFRRAFDELCEKLGREGRDVPVPVRLLGGRAAVEAWFASSAAMDAATYKRDTVVLGWRFLGAFPATPVVDGWTWLTFDRLEAAPQKPADPPHPSKDESRQFAQVVVDDALLGMPDVLAHVRGRMERQRWPEDGDLSAMGDPAPAPVPMPARETPAVTSILLGGLQSHPLVVAAGLKVWGVQTWPDGRVSVALRNPLRDVPVALPEGWRRMGEAELVERVAALLVAADRSARPGAACGWSEAARRLWVTAEALVLAERDGAWRASDGLPRLVVGSRGLRSPGAPDDIVLSAGDLHCLREGRTVLVSMGRGGFTVQFVEVCVVDTPPAPEARQGAPSSARPSPATTKECAADGVRCPACHLGQVMDDHDNFPPGCAACGATGWLTKRRLVELVWAEHRAKQKPPAGPYSWLLDSPWEEVATVLMADGEEDRGFWLLAKRAEWPEMFRNGLAEAHFGDCTRAPVTCIRCLAEQYHERVKTLRAAVS